MPSLLTTRLLRPLRAALVAPLCAIAMALASVGLLRQASAPQMAAGQLAMQDAAQGWAQRGTTTIFGPGVLAADAVNGATIDGTNMLDETTMLGKLNKALDPAGNGAFRPLRKSFEQVALWVIFGGIIFKVGQALATGQGADSRLADIVKRLIVVLGLLWSYILWDYVLFRGIAVPMSTALTSPAIMNQIGGAIASQIGITWTPQGAGASPYRDLSTVNQNAIACGVGQSGGGAVSGCPGGSSLQGRVMTRMYAENQLGAGGNRAAESSLMNSTMMGLIQQGLNLVIGAILWFVWLGVIIGRAFSIVLAPVAIAWGLINPARTFEWFKGHADLCLKPLGLALGGLMAWAFMVTIYAGNIIPSTSVIGTAMKLAIGIMSVMIILKTGSQTKLLAGDVTGAAQSIGQGFTDRALSAGATVVKGGAAAAGAARAGGVSGAWNRMRTSAASGGTRFGVGDKGSSLNKMTAGLGAGLGAVGGAWREASAVRKWVGENKVRDGELNARSLSAPWKTTRGLTIDAYQQARNETWKQQTGKPVAPSDQARSQMESVRSERSRIEEIIKREDVKPARLAGETVDLPTSSLTDRRSINISNQVLGRLAEQDRFDTTLRIDVDDQTGVAVNAIDRDTSATLTRLLDTDPGLAKSVTDVLRGSMPAETIPMIQGTQGMIPDLGKLVTTNATAANIVLDLATRWTAYQGEVTRRSVLSKRLGSSAQVPADSALGRIARQSPMLSEEDDAQAMLTHSMSLARQAWYRASSSSERTAAGLPATANEQEIATLAMRDDVWTQAGLGNLAEAGSWDRLATKAGFSKALRDVQQEALVRLAAAPAMQSEAGALGLDSEHLRLTFRMRFEAAPDSLYGQLRAQQPDWDESRVLTEAERLLSEREKRGEVTPPRRADTQDSEAYNAARQAWRNSQLFSVDAGELGGSSGRTGASA